MTSDQTLLRQWLQAHANISVIPSYYHIGAALQWTPDDVRTEVQTMRHTVPFYTDDHQCVNPWSLIDPETLVTRLFPQHYFSGEWALYTHGICWQRLRVITVAHPAQTPDPAYIALNPEWSLLRITSVFGDTGPDILPSASDTLALATPAQALVDWIAYYQAYPSRDPHFIERFLIDCDPEAVQQSLDTLLTSSLAPLVQTIRKHFPVADARWPKQPWL